VKTTESIHATTAEQEQHICACHNKTNKVPLRPQGFFCQNCEGAWACSFCEKKAQYVKIVGKEK
jgi:hypothetical protein